MIRCLLTLLLLAPAFAQNQTSSDAPSNTPINIQNTTLPFLLEGGANASVSLSFNENKTSISLFLQPSANDTLEPRCMTLFFNAPRLADEATKGKTTDNKEANTRACNFKGWDADCADHIRINGCAPGGLVYTLPPTCEQRDMIAIPINITGVVGKNNPAQPIFTSTTSLGMRMLSNSSVAIAWTRGSGNMQTSTTLTCNNVIANASIKSSTLAMGWILILVVASSAILL
ncbi:uncharacterized protein VTP21DRAFT_3986 [Calcarisporiella thermophila]|uniref:uncharacterized protein n=1 Tax=Calcarisporiella thermophila TaxID=911321 RepID=UPI003743748D